MKVTKIKKILSMVIAILVFASVIIFFTTINTAPVVSYGPRNLTRVNATPVNLPDLISRISNVNVSCKNVSGNCLCNVEFDVTTKNIGMGVAGQSMTVSKIGYSLFNEYPIPPLKQNQNYTFMIGFMSFPSGNYNTLSSYADWYNTVKEQNENNNGFTTPLDAHC